MAAQSTSELLQEEDDPNEDRLEMPGQPYGLALWNLIIRPPRRRYDFARLGPTEFRLWSCRVKRVDVNLRSGRGLQLRCSHFMTKELAEGQTGGVEPQPVVIYLHQNASCRLEALNLVPLLLPLGMSLFCLDFAGCGESEGEYISLGWYERDDLATCVEYLRSTGKVSMIGLWGRSMGAVTALLHADRDHTIAGMVLDSPFCNLTTLASELAQSEYLAVKVPNWLLSGALALGRMRIKSLCGFDIDQLTPERHVGESFIPALFIHGRQDDFIAPHHTQKLFEAYNGDKELEIVEGDHNSPRSQSLIQKTVLFFCRAFRMSGIPANGPGNLASLMGLDALGFSGLSHPVMSRQNMLQAGKHLAMAGSTTGSDAAAGKPPWLGDRQQAFLPFRVEGALQLAEGTAEVGFCLCLCPAPSEWGGMSRPPDVLLAYATANGLCLARATEIGPVRLAHVPTAIELGVPVRFVLELRQGNTTQVRLALGTGECELRYDLAEESDQEAHLWLWDSQRGEGTFFDCALSDLPADPSPDADQVPPYGEFVRVSEGALPPQVGGTGGNSHGNGNGHGSGHGNGKGNGNATSRSAAAGSASAGRPESAGSSAAPPEEGSWCSQQ